MRNKRPIRRRVDYIHPTFAIPEGVDELEYDPKFRTIDDDEETDDSLDDVYLVDSATDEIEEESTIDTPDTITIVSQLIRTGPGGTQTVDVVFDIEDVSGATNYELAWDLA